MNTKQIMPAELVDNGYDTIVANNREGTRLPITGECFESWVLKGFIGVETPFGVLYLDADEPITVESGEDE